MLLRWRLHPELFYKLLVSFNIVDITSLGWAGNIRVKMYWITKYLLALMVLRMAAAPFNDKEYVLAQIIQGEANSQFMHDGGLSAYCVGWVVRNRLAAGWCESYADCQKDFNGTIIKAPQWRYLAIARLVINNKEDPTRGALYVFSQQDIDRLDFDESEASLILRTSEYRALFFFREWPREGQ